MKKRAGFVRSAAQLGAANGLAAILAAGTSVVIARLLGASGRGALEAFLLGPLLISGIGILSASNGVAVMAGKDPARRHVYEAASLLIGVSLIPFWSALLLIPAGLGLVPWLAGDLYSLEVAVMSILAITFYQLNSSLTAVAVSRHNTSLLSRGMLWLAISKLLLILLLAAFTTPTAPIIFGVHIIALAVSVVAVYPEGLWTNAIKTSRRAIAGASLKILNYSLGQYPGDVAQKTNLYLGHILVAAQLELAALGRYGLAVLMADSLLLVSMAVAPLVLARAADTRGDQLEADFPRIFRVTLVLTLAGAVAMGVTAGPLVAAVLGQDFRGTSTILVALLPGVVLSAPSKLATRFLTGRGHRTAVTKVMLVGLTSNLALLAMLLPRSGAIGAAIAASGASTIMAIQLITTLWRQPPHFSPRSLLFATSGDLSVIRGLLRSKS